MMKKREKHFIKTWLQIFLLVGASFAFAYILDSSFEGYEGDSYKENNKSQIRNKLLFVLGIAIKLIFSDRNLVSAQEQIEISDLSKGIATCFTGKDGSICQEYPASKCNDRCAETCFDAPRKETSECKLGTCFDPNFGTCQENSPRFECETKNGQWYDDPAGNVPICKKACCVVGEGVKPLITERECAKIGDVRGIKTEFRADVKGEFECLALAKTQAEGACIVNDECKFTTKTSCLGIHGEFFEGFLCTHPDLKTGYKKQANVKCVEGKEELYWFDDHGNRENIYDANKEKSWNNGKL